MGADTDVACLCVAGDVHLGNHGQCGGEIVGGLNERCRVALATLQRALEVARATRAQAFAVAGDLFDTDRPSPQLVAAVLRMFREYPDLAIHVIPGNHDQRTSEPWDNALAPLRAAGMPHVHVHDFARIVHLTDALRVVFVPFSPRPATAYITDALRVVPEFAGQTVFVAHAGLALLTDPVYMREAHDALRMWDATMSAALGPRDLLLAGNWHFQREEHSSGGGLAAQTTALVPTGWDNEDTREGINGLLHVVRAQWRAGQLVATLDREYVPGPVFIKATGPSGLRDAITRATGAPREGQRFYLWLAPLDLEAEREMEDIFAHTGQQVFHGVRWDRSGVAEHVRAAEAAAAPEMRGMAAFAHMARGAMEKGIAGSGCAQPVATAARANQLLAQVLADGARETQK